MAASHDYRPSFLKIEIPVELISFAAPQQPLGNLVRKLKALKGHGSTGRREPQRLRQEFVTTASSVEKAPECRFNHFLPV